MSVGPGLQVALDLAREPSRTHRHGPGYPVSASLVCAAPASRWATFSGTWRAGCQKTHSWPISRSSLAKIFGPAWRTLLNASAEPSEFQPPELVRLLFDEQLSEELVQHVRLLGVGGAADPAVWQLAREHNCVLVSKDEDFHRDLP